MNNTAKNLVRLTGVVVGLGAAAWALRDKLLPAPEVHPEAPPRFRTGSPSEPSSDDLTAIKGIGPVTAAKLEDAGISGYAQVAEMDAASLAASVGTSEAAAVKWIASAQQLA